MKHKAGPITGVILAGGKGRRMGGADKGLLQVDGHPLVESLIKALAPQVDELILNANRNLETYGQYGYRVLADDLPDYPGPLAGMLTGLRHSKFEYVAFVPCDALTVPADLVMRLWHGLRDTEASVCVAHDGERMHPVYALMRRSCTESIQQYLDSGKHRVEEWVRREQAVTVDFSDQQRCFINLNRPSDIDETAKDNYNNKDRSHL